MGRKHVDEQSRFHAYARAGYSVIPIIPPDGRLSPDSNIDPDQRGKIPGRQNARGDWAGFDWLRARPTRRALERWAESGAGIGIRTGEPGGVIAIDIDCLDPEAAEIMERAVREELDDGEAAPRRVGQAPKSLLVYGVDVLSAAIGTRQLRFRLGPDLDTQLVETRGAGQQFVAEGIHPATGQPYEWDDSDGPPPVDELPVVDDEQIARLFERLAEVVEEQDWTLERTSGSGKGAAERGAIDQDYLAAADTGHMAEAVAAIPNTTQLFPGRPDYIRMANAIKAAFRDDPDRGEDAWLDWCSRWADPPDGEGNDLEIARADYRRCKPPFELGAPWLYEQAREHGGFNDAPRLFEPVPDAEGGEDSERSGTEGGGGTGVEFWDRYVWVEELERFADLWQQQLLSPMQFAVRYPHIGKGVRSSQNAAVEYWNNQAKRRIVRKCTYRPGGRLIQSEAGTAAVNTWRPGPAHRPASESGWLNEDRTVPEVTDDDVRPYLDLVEHIIPDERERNLVLDWLAYQLQYPDRKTNFHLVLGSTRHGLGKDTMVMPITEGLGSENVSHILPDDLHREWTHWADSTRLCVVQEMNSFHRVETMNKLKPYMSRPPAYIQINKKGMPQYEIPNLINLVFMTNHQDAISIEKSDRRFFVIWSEAEPWDSADYTALHKWLEQHGGMAAVCQWLAHRDLSGFDAQGQAPATAAKADMERAARGGIDGSLEDAIEDRDGPFGKDVVQVEEVRAYIEQQGGGHINERRVGNALKRIGCEYLGRARWGEHGTRSRFWLVRPDSPVRQRLEWATLGAVYEQQVSEEARAKFRPDEDEGEDEDGLMG